jgi:nucleotide-binding universal stress UspA family protein
MKSSPTATPPRSKAKALRIENILVPIDFSEMSIGAIATAKRLARRFGATVHLANIHESSYPAGFLELGTPFAFAPLTYLEDTREAAEKRLNDLAEKHGITGTCVAEVGGPAFDGICKIARQTGTNLIVTPTHGRGGMKHILLGSTAERLVQHSPCPVLVTRERSKERPTRAKTSVAGSGRIDTILVPVDFSHASLEGLKYAIQFARKVRAKIVVLSVIHYGYAYTADGYAMYDLSPLEEAAHAAAAREMQLFVRRVRFGAVKLETAIEIGPPVQQICAFAEKRKADLIITPTHGYTGFQHVMIGSTAEQVVRRAPCPVLVVPSHPELRVGQIAKQTEAQRPRSRSTTAPAPRVGLVLSGQPRRSGRSPYRIGSRPQAKKYREPAAS